MLFEAIPAMVLLAALGLCEVNRRLTCLILLSSAIRTAFGKAKAFGKDTFHLFG